MIERVGDGGLPRIVACRRRSNDVGFLQISAESVVDEIGIKRSIGCGGSFICAGIKIRQRLFL